MILACRNGDEQDPAAPRARLTRPHDVDLSVVSSWLDFCNNTHDTCCEMHDQLASLRMIDCRKKKIVRAPTDCAYVCLSYVWGKSTKERNINLDLDSDHLPMLFKDAMVVTQKLGFMYLWVDRNCIPQDQPGEKHYQIRNMDKIYACAAATIVASCSPDATVGLAGISGNRGLEKPWAQVGKNSFTAVNQNYRELIRTSKWNSRGWTYQEALLSRRTIVFTESMVYFECEYGYFEESLDQIPFSLTFRPSEPRLFSRYPVRKSRSVFHAAFDGFDVWKLIAEYLCRQLTYESDILYAIFGIFQSYCSDYPAFQHVWGIPLLPGMDGYKRNFSGMLTEGLCWASETSLTRREGFPSWSWAGWRWPDMIRDAIGPPGMLLPAIPMIDDLSFVTDTGYRIGIDDYFATPTEERPDIGPSLIFKAWITPIQLVVGGGGISVRVFREGETVQLKVIKQPPVFKLGGQPIYGVIICTAHLETDDLFQEFDIYTYMLLTEYDGVSFTRIGNLPLIDIHTPVILDPSVSENHLPDIWMFQQEVLQKICSLSKIKYREVDLR